MSGQTLFMTATIAPAANTYLLKVTDPRERLDQYKESLGFYVSQLKAGVFDRIVFVDNSGRPLDELEEVADAAGASSQVEFVSYQSSIEPIYSRFYLEMNLIVQAMARSAFLRSDSCEVIWKVTGRYIVRNIAGIVRNRPPAFDLYVNMRNFPERALDFYLVAFPRAQFEAHLGRDIDSYESVRHGEIILREKIETGEFGDMKIVKRFTRTPRLLGVRGFDGARYGGAADTAKYLIRAAANRTCPWLWI